MSSEFTGFSDDVTCCHLTLVTCLGRDVYGKVQGPNLPTAIINITGTSTIMVEHLDIKASKFCTGSTPPEDKGETLLTNQDKEEQQVSVLGRPALGQHVKLEVTIEESYEFKVRAQTGKEPSELPVSPVEN